MDSWRPWPSISKTWRAPASHLAAKAARWARKLPTRSRTSPTPPTCNRCKNGWARRPRKRKTDNPMREPDMKPADSCLTERPAWRALAAHYQQMREVHLRKLFADDPGRGERMTIEAAGIFLDYSKN